MPCNFDILIRESDNIVEASFIKNIMKSSPGGTKFIR